MADEVKLGVRPADAEAKAPPEKNKTFDPEKDIEPHILAKLDPQWVALFTAHVDKNPPPPAHLVNIEYIRVHPEKFAPACALDTKGYPRTAENEVVSEDGARVPVRIYYPDEKTWGPGPYPVHLNFHGECLTMSQLMQRIETKHAQAAASCSEGCPTSRLCA